MGGQLKHSPEGDVGVYTVGDETLVPPKSEVSASRDEVLKGDKQGAPSGRQRDALRRLGRVTLPSVVLAFLGGILLGTQVRPQRVHQDIAVGLPTLKDSEGLQLPPEAPPSSSLPEKNEAVLGADEARGEDVAEPKLLHDSWGLCSLSHFEKTLSPELKQGKEEIAAVLRTSCMSKHQPDAKLLEKDVASALSGGEADTLVGTTIPLNYVNPVARSRGKEDPHVPVSVRVTRVLRLGYPSILMEVEDTKDGKVYTMRIRLYAENAIQALSSKAEPVALLQEWGVSESVISKQACSGTPATLVATEKGLVVPLFEGHIAKVTKPITLRGLTTRGSMQLLERLPGEFDFTSLITSNLSVHAKEYIAHRLLQIVLKLQQALLSHNDLRWENVYAHPDGTFVLSGFDACSPFGKAIGPSIRLRGETLEPTLRIQQGLYSSRVVPAANSDLWSLGMLLYELFTDGKLPYTEDETVYTKDAMRFAKQLIDADPRPELLTIQLDAANCPFRWKLLILKLLQPIRGERVTARDILTEFPDLVQHSLSK
ncbi:hypothetical protein EBH_0034040 [Eimeria brunetti]|uniref:Protein kinase domain-containing protein n=1 Tax=Eimeria brunetti TaxID=51314 RepID=U6LPJ8_9EIME|nr:hypothetical protein EBH_0034040 [Eimeria brunetti]